MLLAMALIVATPFVYISVLFVFDQAARVGGPEPFLVASVVTGGLFVLCWIRLWYHEVNWSGKRWLWTVLAVAGAAVPSPRFSPYPHTPLPLPAEQQR